MVNFITTQSKKHMKIQHLIIFSLLLSLSASCQSAITKIGIYSQSGGEDGSYSFIEITKDSINYHFGHYYPSVLKKEGRKKTPTAIWEKLKSDFDLAEFKQIKSTESRMAYDGVDDRIMIEIGKDK